MERLKGEGVQDWLSQHLTAPWHGHQTVASELTNDILLNIRERWSQLDNPVRVSVLFSLISLKKAQQVELKQKCQELIDHACSDPDDWVRLIAQMLQDYPTEGTLRFNVEQFADQAQLGTQLQNLEKHIKSDGIKFHPKEWAYLNTSVWHPPGCKDPKEPSIHQHFVLKKQFRNNHSERSERLRKLAEKAGTFSGGVNAGPLSPTVLGPGSSVHLAMSGSAGGPSASAVAGGSGGTSSGVPGVPGLPPGASGQPGAHVPGSSLPPPRPTKPASGGLFVTRKPKSITLPRNPSTLPLRSPRTDGPPMPRLNQKLSRIQILDIQEGTEIMQSMKDDKLRQEQEEQRQREQKKEQRQQELELKRQQEAEKKAQLQREKEEKQREKEERKREREDAKREKERLRLEREERAARERELANAGDVRKRAQSDDEDDDEEGGLSRKKSRTNPRSGRKQLTSDYDHDMQDVPEHASPVQTPGPGSTQQTPMDYNYSQSRDSYFPNYEGAQPSSQQQQQQASQHATPSTVAHPPPSEPPLDSPAGHPTLFQNTNLLTPEDRAYITAFLEGVPVIRPNATDTLYQIVMNQEQVTDPVTGKTMYELILIEMNFETGEWRKIKRKRNRPHVPPPAADQQQPPPPPPSSQSPHNQQGYSTHQPIVL
ncbi:hypothetical protein BGW42_001923 [Actinomortierella wolfii]|nr:hypothetical protein BGW42_001923 [Actinomortierella wolfii]